jgi:integrase
VATRKPNRRSSIYQGPDGRWHGYVTIGRHVDGRPDRRHVRGSTESEVTRKVRKLERERDSGVISWPGRSPTVEQWLGTYLNTIANQRLAPRTWDDYWSKARNWIIPSLGKRRLDELLPEHLDELYLAMRRAGKADSHVLKVHRIMSRALTVAVRRGKVSRNVAQFIDPPSVKQAEIVPLSRAEVKRVIAASLGLRNGVRWSVGLAAGLRQGEVLGLRWSYVDLETGDVHVWWQLQRGTWRHGCIDPHACGSHRGSCAVDCERHARRCPQRQGGGLILREPKGRNRREITLPGELIEILRAHRVEQDTERASAYVWDERGFVFCREDGSPIDPRRDWQDWKDLLSRAGVRDVRVHDGRHTAGTLLVDQGVHIRVIQEILGHSDVRVTERYTHVASPAIRDAAGRMGAALWGSDSEPTATTTATGQSGTELPDREDGQVSK